MHTCWLDPSKSPIDERAPSRHSIPMNLQTRGRGGGVQKNQNERYGVKLHIEPKTGLSFPIETVTINHIGGPHVPAMRHRPGDGSDHCGAITRIAQTWCNLSRCHEVQISRILSITRGEILRDPSR